MKPLKNCLTILLLTAPLATWAAATTMKDALAQRATTRTVSAHTTASANNQGSFSKVLIPYNKRQLADIEYQQALRSITTGDMAQAQTHLLAALHHEALHVAARQLLATIDTHQHQNHQAMVMLQQGVNLLPQEPVFNLMLARLYAQQGQAERGIALLEKLTVPVLLRNKVDAMQADLYRRAARYEDAIALYRKLLQRNPHKALWWLGLAMSLEASRRPANALIAYQQARSEKPGQQAVTLFINARIEALSNASGNSGSSQKS